MLLSEHFGFECSKNSVSGPRFSEHGESFGFAPQIVSMSPISQHTLLSEGSGSEVRSSKNSVDALDVVII